MLRLNANPVFDYMVGCMLSQRQNLCSIAEVMGSSLLDTINLQVEPKLHLKVCTFLKKCGRTIYEFKQNNMKCSGAYLYIYFF